MSSKVKSLEDALQKRKAKREEEAQAQSFSVEGEAPVRVPHVGEAVEFTWADPTLVGSPQLTLGFFVSLVIPSSKDGRINGWCLMDPTMQMADPHGRPVQVPPMIPVANAAYSRERKPMTWRFHGDAVVAETPVEG
jgi:hypothetical protein